LKQAVAELFRANGYHIRLAGGANDRGIDIYLAKEGQRAVVQCKRYRQKVTPSQIRDFIGAMNGAGVETGYFVTTSGYTRAAREAAERSSYHIHLVNGRDLGRWQSRVSDAKKKGAARGLTMLPKTVKILLWLVGLALLWMVLIVTLYWMGTK
jgi:restriction endonuclease Mrr